MKWLAVLLSALGLAYGQSNMRFVADKDQFTDADRSHVLVYANEQTRFRGANVLVWRCRDGSDFDLFVANQEYLTNSGLVPVIYRFDDAGAVSEQWSVSTCGTAAFSANAVNKQRFTSAAFDSAQVIIGVTDFRGVRYSYTFRLLGLRNMLDRLNCVTLEARFPQITTMLTLAEAYRLVKEAVSGLNYAEGLNVMYFDNLTLRFIDSGASRVLDFAGTSRALYERIRAAFD